MQTYPRTQQYANSRTQPERSTTTTSKHATTRARTQTNKRHTHSNNIVHSHSFRILIPFKSIFRYRALIESVDQESGSIRVFFVDFGNRQSIQVAASSQDIKPLAPIFIDNMPPFAYRCSLLPNTDRLKWVQEDIDSFKDAVLEKEFSATFFSKTTTSTTTATTIAASSYFVELREGNALVGEELIKRHSARALSSSPLPLESPNSNSWGRPPTNQPAEVALPKPFKRIPLPPDEDLRGELYHPVRLDLAFSCRN